MSSKKNSAKMRAKRNQRYNKMAMVGISIVVCMLLVVLFVQGQSVRERISANNQKQDELAQQIEDENKRTEDIENMQEYMQSDEYIEKIAKEKIGLVKENEIIFKEAD
ncbi:septum formation initiator family protein [Ruminococcus sp. OA3]|uniref:FtsB family cell division protein n=1 Tax=Ruminococcus sp. OA3 TaxID=2914164 RepID=UPI001F0686DB|nr:septum formation initiator family protein [Ruminococcus sp. OA3]MCH1981905.1 septum formation initiator family protein [Ruminococcus sp. OA3]